MLTLVVAVLGAAVVFGGASRRVYQSRAAQAEQLLPSGSVPTPGSPARPRATALWVENGPRPDARAASPLGASGSGFGLPGMRERIELLGGSCPRQRRTRAGPCGQRCRCVVVVADDQRAVREGLVTLLTTMPEVEVVGSAGDGEAALALVTQLNPDVVLMDLWMPRLDGLEATRRVRAEHPSTQVVILTTYADDESILHALRAGPIGCLTKVAGGDGVTDAHG